jgi:hypothetical protein
MEFSNALFFPEENSIAGRTEMTGHGVAAFGCSHPLYGFTGQPSLVAAKARLIANHGTGTALAG